MMETVLYDIQWGLDMKTTVIKKNHKKNTPFDGQYGSPKPPPKLHSKVKTEADMYNFS